jgi:hypothetical protein
MAVGVCQLDPDWVACAGIDSTSSGDAGDRIVDIAKGAHKRVLLNLEKLEYVSSAGLRVILRGAKLLQVHPPVGATYRRRQ